MIRNSRRQLRRFQPALDLLPSRITPTLFTPLPPAPYDPGTLLPGGDPGAEMPVADPSEPPIVESPTDPPGVGDVPLVD